MYTWYCAYCLFPFLLRLLFFVSATSKRRSSTSLTPEAVRPAENRAPQPLWVTESHLPGWLKPPGSPPTPWRWGGRQLLDVERPGWLHATTLGSNVYTELETMFPADHEFQDVSLDDARDTMREAKISSVFERSPPPPPPPPVHLPCCYPFSIRKREKASRSALQGIISR